MFHREGPRLAVVAAAAAAPASAAGAAAAAAATCLAVWRLPTRWLPILVLTSWPYLSEITPRTPLAIYTQGL